MEVNAPDVLAEIEAVFARYEAALTSNDIATLDALFLDSPQTVRFGIGENLYGIAEIREFRSQRSSSGLERRLGRTLITSYGRDVAIAATLFYREAAPGKVGRQMQTWVRTAHGWRVAAAHVSIIDELSL